MKFDAHNYPPLKDLDGLEENVSHNMVIYDKEEYGKLVRNRFIENGLKKGESSVYLTHGDPTLIENEFEEYGIDVDFFKRKKQLHIFQIENIMEHIERVPLKITELLKQVTSGIKLPYRITGRPIPNVSTTDGIEAELIIERMAHSNFNKYSCSILCSYAIDEIESIRRPMWVSQLLQNHHNLIYATEPAKAVTFDPDMLDTFRV